MRRQGCRPWFAHLSLSFLTTAFLLTGCQTTPAQPAASPPLTVGDCISVTDIGEDDASPQQKVPCPPLGTIISNSDFYAVYRIVFATTLAVPIMSRSGADDLATIYCRGPEITPGKSLYVFPTEASFDAGFKQFLCLSH